MRFSTDDWPEWQRRSAAIDFYASLFRQDIEPLPDQSFLMRGTVRHFPGLRCISVTTLGLNYRRRSEHITSDDVLVNLNIEGTRILFNRGREFRITGGEGLAGNEDESWGVSIPGLNRYISLRISADSLPRVAKARLHACQSISSNNDVLRLLRSYVPVLAESESVASPAAQALAVSHIRDLVSALLDPSQEQGGVAERNGVRAAKLRAIKEDIVRNLRCDLSVAVVAARHRLSPRYVQKLFEGEGNSFTQYILDARLTCARRLLSDPRQADEKIASIAFAAGLGDVSYFYRAFRQRYGATPSDVRAQALRAN